MKPFWKKLANPDLILVIFIVFSLVFGFFVFRDFGRSTDEAIEFRRSDLARKIYTNEIDSSPMSTYSTFGVSKYYGTASTVLVRFSEQIFKEQGKNLYDFDIAHFTYFVFFQIGVAALYFLSKQFVNRWIALGTTLLFGTQPLLVGHAFINPKDIPHMAVFLLTVVSGFSMVDRWLASQNGAGEEEDDPGKKRKKMIYFAILVLLTLGLWISPAVRPALLDLVEYSYHTKGESLTGKIFASLTTSGSLEGYQILAEMLFTRFLRWVALVSLIGLVILFIWGKRKPNLGILADPRLLIAAILWGFAVSTRVLAIAAGGMVGIYAIVKLKKQAALPLIVYTLAASIITFITWPFVWFFGVGGVIDSLIRFSDFGWHDTVLFEGSLVYPEELPIRFIPKLMALQFTEPVVILTLIGFILSLVLLVKKRLDLTKTILILAWFLLPIAYLLIKKPVYYGNFRQYLFITPPLFIIAGLALEQITSRIKPALVNAAIIILLLVPGVYSILQLHPYQYVYYNQFVGGVEGAFRQYELDYWGTAYKEAMEFVNQNVSPGSKIITWSNADRGEIYADYKFHFVDNYQIPEYAYPLFDYALIPSRRSRDLMELPDAPTVYTIQVDNAVLMVVKQIPGP